MEVLCVFGVGDEHCRPLLKLQVRETQQVVVKGQDPVPVRRTHSTVVYVKEKGRKNKDQAITREQVYGKDNTPNTNIYLF